MDGSLLRNGYYLSEEILCWLEHSLCIAGTAGHGCPSCCHCCLGWLLRMLYLLVLLSRANDIKSTHFPVFLLSYEPLLRASKYTGVVRSFGEVFSHAQLVE